MYKSALTLCLLTLLLLAMQPLHAQEDNQTERIRLYHSDITVRPDASMQVTETITVYAAHDKISHGIYRDFPTHYPDKYGNRVNLHFNLVSVLRDGAPEPYHTESLSNGVRIYMGDKDSLVDVGEHSYILTYETNRQLGFFPDHDELYWNVTGNGWVFPIDKASATVTLPAGITSQQIKVEGYTGVAGAKGQAYKASVDASSQAQFVTTTPLASNEGFTIVVSFPKGFVTKPTSRQLFIYLLQDNFNLIIGFIGLILVLGYFIVAWSMVGKDPAKGVIIPLYTPPQDYSPAALRFISRMGYDNKAFAATIINAAVKGTLTIGETTKGIFGLGKSYTVTQTDKPLSPDTLATEEATLISELFTRLGSTVVFENTYYSEIQQAIKAFTTILKGRFQDRFFSRNLSAFLPGLLLAILAEVAIIYCTVRQNNDADMGRLVGGLMFTGIPMILFVVMALPLWKKVFTKKGCLLASLLPAILITLFLSTFIVVGLVGFGFTQFSVLILLVILCGIVVLFYYLLRAPTLAGRKLMDQIEGFRLYLEVAEKDELNLSNPPEKTPALFEAYLPYALALDVEQAWSNKFAAVLAQATVGGQPYHPGWYYGSSWGTLGAAGFASSLGDSFSSAISSSSTAPGSSSGSGGGGSSGGGGGGGGGGGW